VLKDAHLVYAALRRDGRLLREVFVMGRSLGSAPAIELCAAHKDIAGCIIESGYADPVPLVRRRGLHVDTIAPEDHALFNNSQKITGIRCPLLIMHGDEDWLISSDEAELNFRKAGSRLKTLKILNGVGHNDMTMAHDNAYFSCLKWIRLESLGIIFMFEILF
jgi:pimeloyl-ACP methyl ester carboxylesterase